jgi:hypothetical protein
VWEQILNQLLSRGLIFCFGALDQSNRLGKRSAIASENLVFHAFIDQT